MNLFITAVVFGSIAGAWIPTGCPSTDFSAGPRSFSLSNNRQQLPHWITLSSEEHTPGQEQLDRHSLRLQYTLPTDPTDPVKIKIVNDGAENCRVFVAYYVISAVRQADGTLRTDTGSVLQNRVLDVAPHQSVTSSSLAAEGSKGQLGAAFDCVSATTVEIDDKFRKASDAIERHDEQAGMDLCAQAAAADPNWLLGSLYHAALCLGTRKYEPAIGLTADALATFERSSYARVRLREIKGQAEYFLGRYGVAQEDLTKSIAGISQPKAFTLHLLADTEFIRGDWDLALGHMSRAVASSPYETLGDDSVYLAMIMSKAGKLRPADYSHMYSAWWDQAVAKDPWKIARIKYLGGDMSETDLRKLMGSDAAQAKNREIEGKFCIGFHDLSSGNGNGKALLKSLYQLDPKLGFIETKAAGAVLAMFN